MAYEEVKSMDRTFAIVSASLFAGLSAATVAAAVVSGVAGVGALLLAWIIAIPVWGKVTRDWLVEREKLLAERRVEGGDKLLAELEKLREAIERLNRSLEG